MIEITKVRKVRPTIKSLTDLLKSKDNEIGDLNEKLGHSVEAYKSMKQSRDDLAKNNRELSERAEILKEKVSLSYKYSKDLELSEQQLAHSLRNARRISSARLGIIIVLLVVVVVKVIFF